MNQIIRNKRTSLFLSIAGFITAASFCIYAFFIYQSSKPKITNGPSFSVDYYGSYDSPYDAFLRFGLIAILFVVSAFITRFTNNVLLKLLNILLLAVICFQGYIALREPIDALYYLYEDDSSLLIRIIALFICFAGLIILPAVILIILQFFSIRNSITGKNSDSLN